MSKHRNNIRRRKNPKAQRIIVWIFTDGQNTERAYFQTLARYQNVNVKIPKECAGKSPNDLFDKALETKTEAKSSDDASRDQFWVVFDDDGRNGVTEARTRCRQAGLNAAVSNPCFEVWLLLHLTDYDRPDNQAAVQRELECQCPTYERGRRKLPDFESFIENINIAESRAENLDNRRVAQGNPNGRPSTQVYKLTRALRDT